MGSNITEERGLYAALNNCAFVSTEAMREDASKPFVFLMDASMLGYAPGGHTRHTALSVPTRGDALTNRVSLACAAGWAWASIPRERAPW